MTFASARARLKTVWILAGSIAAASGAAAVHWHLNTPVYEARTSILVPHVGRTAGLAVADDGQLEAEVLDKVAERLEAQDVPLAATRPEARERLETDVCGQVATGTGADEVTIRLRTTHPDLAVSVLRTVSECWLDHLGGGTKPAAASNAELEAIHVAIERQKSHLKTLSAPPPIIPDSEEPQLRRQRDLKKAALADVGVDRDEGREVLQQLQSDEAATKSLEQLVEALPNPIVRNRAWSLLRRLELEQELQSQQVMQARFQTVYGRNHPKRRAVEDRVSTLAGELGDAAVPQAPPLGRLAALVEEHTADLDIQYRKLETEIADLDTRLGKDAERRGALRDATMELSRLEEQRNTAQQKAEARSLAPTTEVVQPPTLLMSPVWPVLWHHVAGSLAVGLAAGAFLAWRASPRRVCP